MPERGVYNPHQPGLSYDEPSVADFMQNLLAHWGLTVVLFEDGGKALEAIACGDAFDLVITDQTMPRMTGIEFARAVREVRPGLKVVLYTGYGEGIASADIDGAGLAGLLRKPIESSELLALLATHLRPNEGHS